MSTSRVSLIGLPLSMDSSTANSRERSCRIRAILYKYLARSAPGIGPQTCSYAVRAMATARSTSAGPASATWVSDSSVAGFTVANVRPVAAGVNSPFTYSPYSGRMDTMSRDSGAGAYGQPRSVDSTAPGPDAASVPRAGRAARRAASLRRSPFSAKNASHNQAPHSRTMPKPARFLDLEGSGVLEDPGSFEIM